MIAFMVLLVACGFVFGCVGELFNLDSRDTGTLITWGTTITICSLLLYFCGILK